MMDVDNLFINGSEIVIDENKMLGNGAWARVYLAENNNDHKLYACKIYHSSNSDHQLYVMRAALAQQMLVHPAILKFCGLSFSSLKDYTVFQPTILSEYMPKGSLRDILKKEERKSLTDEAWNPTKKYIILLGIAHALKFSHKHGVIHRDIKADNILLDDNYYPKLSGFTLCRIFNHPLEIGMKLEMSSSVGTPLYMAPELYDGTNYGAGVDVYSYSFLAFELVTGIAPYQDQKFTSPQFFLEKVKKGERPVFTNDVTQPMKELISRCWNADADERPSFDEIYEKLSTDYKSYYQFDVDENEIRAYIDTLNQS